MSGPATPSSSPPSPRRCFEGSRTGRLVDPQPPPTLVPQFAQGADISAVYLLGIAHRGNCSCDAVLAQQVQHRIGRAVGVVFDVLGFSFRELVLRMKARDLQFALQP